MAVRKLILVSGFIFLSWYAIHLQRKPMMPVQTTTKTETPSVVSEPPPEPNSIYVPHKSAPAPAIRIVAEDGNYSKERFEEILESARRALPKKSDLENLTEEEAHHAPRQLLEGATQLSNVAEILERHPDLREMSLDFYKSCADNKELVDAVRARCLSNYRRHSRELGKKVDLKNYSSQIVRLSDFSP